MARHSDDVDEMFNKIVQRFGGDEERALEFIGDACLKAAAKNPEFKAKCREVVLWQINDPEDMRLFEDVFGIVMSDDRKRS